jgi:hypothetical protein
MRVHSVVLEFPEPDPRELSETPAEAEIDERRPRC